ncbi:MAG TPA: hypothetical protein VNG33_12995 [Polyangiaceae bacterium]|nr:hypothetical protein [Polyangiaceae bacterium]
MRNSQDSPADPSVREQLQGASEFLRRALRHFRAVLVTVLVGGVALAVFLELHQPKFRSETVILYVEKGNKADDTESSDAERAVTTRLRELLFARPSLEHVVTQFGLYPELHRSYGMVDAAEELKKHVQFRAPGGDTFSIAFEGNAAAQAQGVTAELARLVIDGDATLRRSQAKVALDFLVGERQTRELELRAAEEKLAGFMAKHPRFALDATPLANGAAIRASMGAAAGAAPGAPKAWPLGGSSAAPASRPASPVPIAAASAGNQNGDEARARAALAAARETLTERLVHYTPAHPDVRAAEADVQRAQQRLAAISGGGGAAAPAAPADSAAMVTAPAEPAPPARPAWVTLPRPAAAAAAAAAASGADNAQTLVELETQWLQLTRAVSEARQRLDQIEEQLFRADVEVSSETGGHGVQVSVIDPAFLPERPLPPGPLTLGLLFAGGSLVLGVLLALILAAFDQRIFTARDANAILPVLASVPKDSKRRAYVTS